MANFFYTEPRRTVFADIKHLLPADCWAVWRNTYRQGEFEQEPVAVYDQPTELATLLLDYEATGPAAPLLILVRGSLTVRDFIYNEELDAATGLVVLGDLRAGTMLVGGQEIYVAGSLVVEEVFWGDYNHGNLRVLGDAKFGVYAAVDYEVAIKGHAETDTCLTPAQGATNWQGLDVALVQATLVAEAVSTETILLDEEAQEWDEELTLERKAALSLLQSGQSLCKK